MYMYHTRSRVCLARSLTKGRAMGGILVEAAMLGTVGWMFEFVDK